jgi:hypothetical protein
MILAEVQGLDRQALRQKSGAVPAGIPHVEGGHLQGEEAGKPRESDKKNGMKPGGLARQETKEDGEAEKDRPDGNEVESANDDGRSRPLLLFIFSARHAASIILKSARLVAGNTLCYDILREAGPKRTWEKRRTAVSDSSRKT